MNRPGHTVRESSSINPARNAASAVNGFIAEPGINARRYAPSGLTKARTRPVRIAPRMAVTAHAVNSFAPNAVDAIMKRQRVQPED